MKRQAVAAEYNQRPRGMESWYREVGLTSDAGRALLQEADRLGMKTVGAAHNSEPTMRSLLQEAHDLGLTNDVSLPEAEAVSAALPTVRAAREYAKAEPA